MPVVLLGDGIPGPVAGLVILKDDSRIRVDARVVRPDIELAESTVRWAVTSARKPRMLVRGVVDHELRDNAETTTVSFPEEALEVAQFAVDRADGAIVG